MGKWLLLALLVVVGCGEGVPVRVVTELPEDEIQPLLVEAEEILDLTFDETNESYAAITLDIHRVSTKPPGPLGRAIWRKGCKRVGWAHTDAAIIAHEIAHLLGLDHVDDEDNLMHSSVGGTELTGWQHDDMEKNLRRFLAC